MLWEILPNARGPLIVDFCLRIGYTTILLGTLGFFGLGVSPESPDWGSTINEGRRLLTIYPHPGPAARAGPDEPGSGPQPAGRWPARREPEGLMANFRTKIRRTQNLRTKVLAIGVALCATPVTASQPVWQPAIYCAALDFTRAELLTDMGGAGSVHPRVPMHRGAPISDRRRGARLPVPGRASRAISRTQGLSLQHRIEVAISYGVDPRSWRFPSRRRPSWSARLNFDPELLAAARAAEATDPPEPLCPVTE
jgi:hypothetical protein